MPLVTLDDLTIGFRGPLLLDGVSARIEAGQRIGLLGRNGAGKTTLLRMLDGRVQPDHGTITYSSGTKVARLSQQVPVELDGTVAEIVRRAEEQQATVETQWEMDRAVETTLTQMDLDGDLPFQTLSSGLKRRVLLARAIVSHPDLLLLDEPTNHLDIPSILWLEDFFRRWSGTLVFVTHDRSFLQNLATRIWEIDRGQLFDWSCDYETFLQRKEAALAAAEKQEALFDKKLAQEEAWIRQGIKARRTRNEGRVRALKAMREKRHERRKAEGTANMQLQQADRSGALVAEVKHVSFAYGDHTILNDFSTVLMRGDKVGIIGPNGAGKTTLLKVLLGKLQPDQGSVRLGTNLQIAYFDQLRDTLDPDQTVQENIGEGREQVRVGDKTKHIIGYLQDFLFTPERARTKVRFLSGGERNRALLAKLMTKPANVIVLDEPTNDLDSETLELLEEQLMQFEGTLLMVSHDRTFLNNVVTSTIVFEEGGVGEYVGGYDDWRAVVQRREAEQTESQSAGGKSGAGKSASGKAKTAAATTASSLEGQQGQTKENPAATRKLSYNEQRELKGLPGQIESLEAEIATLHEAMAEPEYYQQPSDRIATDAGRLKELESKLEHAYIRWEELESLEG